MISTLFGNMACSLRIVAFALGMGTNVGLYEMTVDLQPKRPVCDVVDRAELVSLANSNDSYNLTLFRAKPFSSYEGRLGIAAGKNSAVITSGGSGPDSSGAKEYDVSAVVNDAGLIAEIIKYYHPVVYNRHNPGNRMLATFVPAKKEFALKEPVIVKMKITNVGGNEFAFVSWGERHNFAFTAHSQHRFIVLPDFSSSAYTSIQGSGVSLKPGENHQESVNLSKWFEFKESGVYFIKGSYFLNIEDLKSHHTIWEDVASADFQVKIK